MGGHVHWIVTVDLKDGALDDFKALMEEMVTATEANEPGALNYEWFLTPDGKSCQIYERYADSDAARTHMGTFMEKYAARFNDLSTQSGFDLYGEPDEQLSKMFGKMGAEARKPIGGFARY